MTRQAPLLGDRGLKYDGEIFQWKVLSLLLFVIALIRLTLILRTDNSAYESQTGGTINHLLFMDDLNLYSKSKKSLDSLIQIVRIAKTLECKLRLINVSDEKVGNIEAR